MDTGVDYLHPALGGCFGKSCLISYGYDLVGDKWTGLNNPVPDDDPYDDCIGHGTHVSGIIAAQPNKMNFTGVAPKAKLGMYKVFSCLGSGTTDDVLIKALLVTPIPCSFVFHGHTSGWRTCYFKFLPSKIVLGSEETPKEDANKIILRFSTMAFEDGSDVITASIGGFGGWSEVPWSVVVSRIVDVSVCPNPFRR